MDMFEQLKQFRQENPTMPFIVALRIIQALNPDKMHQACNDLECCNPFSMN
jgi:hypothetical protein